MEESFAVPFETVPANKVSARTNTIADLRRFARWPIGFR
jgi:hypothetical protein